MEGLVRWPGRLEPDLKTRLHYNGRLWISSWCLTYSPRGDQATAIEQLVGGLREGEKHQVLLGVTGSGKTFTMAKVVEKLNRPTTRSGP